MPQDQSAAPISDATVSSFLELPSDKQRDALGKLSDPAKQALLTGIKSRNMGAGASASAATSAPNSILGGFGRRAKDAVTGLIAPPQSTAESIAGPLVLPYRMAKGAISSEAKAGKQALSYAGNEIRDIRAGDYKGAAGDDLRAGVTAASMLDPFATGTVADTNEMQDQGRTREAIGTAAFDTLTLLLGSAIGREPTTRGKLSNLVGAVGDTGETAKNLKPVLSEIEQTARATGKPATVGDLAKIVGDTKDRIDQAYNRGLFPIRSQQVMPIEISSRIRRLITPDMQQTAEGKATSKYIESRAREYDKPWTYNQLNAKRVTENANIKGYFPKDASAQNAAARSNEDTAISKAIRDGAAEVVTRGIDRANPGLGAQALKTKQGHLIALQDTLNDRVAALEDKQLASESKTLSEKLRPRAYVGESGPRAYVSRVGESLPGGGPEKAANAKVTRAFGPSAKATGARAAVLALPVSHLSRRDLVKSAKGLPPPPEPSAQ